MHSDLLDSLAAKSDVIRFRPVAQWPDFEACYQQIHGWMQECVNEHRNSCPLPQKLSPLPTRVIDVSPIANPEIPRVLKTGREPGSFVALSHCWGSKSRYILDSETLRERLRGMTMTSLPPTFRDAIIVTRGLGYRYLWIDSLCILQDSYEDWDNKSGKMLDYYVHSRLVSPL
jgi:hypothetical protein